MPEWILGKPGEKAVLMCNEAIARGVIESGVKVACGYPGTPSSEVIENLGKHARNMHVEWSTNEKVAMEVASAAAIAGVRAFVGMKMVGMNVASDSLLTINLSGVNAGFLILVADDPGAWVSQNEQDSRFYAKFANLPMFEPSSPQEARDMVVHAYAISESLGIPVMLRTVTRLAHSSGDVTLGEISEQKKFEGFKKDFDRYYMGDVVTVARLEWLNKQMGKVREISETTEFNRLEMKGDEKIGLIACNMAYNYSKEAVKLLGMEKDVAFLKIGVSHPLPERMIKKFMEKVDKVLVVEESMPFIEERLKGLLCELNRKVEVCGRLNEHIPIAGELTAEIVASALAKMTSREYRTFSAKEEETFKEISNITPSRSAFSFCAGCPHLGTFYALKKVLRKRGKLQSYFNAGDIGCYLIAMLPPMSVMDTSFDMGASIAQACGFYHAGFPGPVISSIGDSTFFHAGIPPLLNAVVNKAKIAVLVCDNRTTAMTGHQPHPGSGVTVSGEKTKEISIAKVAKACGADLVIETDPYDFEATSKAIEKALDCKGTSVIVARRLCAVLALRCEGAKTAFVVEEKKCRGCKLCVSDFGCMAIGFDEKRRKANVDKNLCIGCGLCAQICSAKAFMRSKK